MAERMTGYGVEARGIVEEQITIEMKSVNHRFLDIKVNLPHSLTFLEEKIKKIIKNYIYRGRIEVYVIIDNDYFIKKTLVTDWNLMDQYVNQYKLAKECYGLAGDLSVSSLSSIPELFKIQEVDNQPTELIDYILETTERVCQQVQDSRSIEGEYLK